MYKPRVLLIVVYVSLGARGGLLYGSACHGDLLLITPAWSGHVVVHTSHPFFAIFVFVWMVL
jgi:hypothetical protein